LSAWFVGRALAADVPDLAALAAECFDSPWTLRQMADEVALGPPNAVLVARGRTPGSRGAALVAFCAYRVVLDELQVLDVAVHPASRRRGLARLLLHLALRAGARAGARVALLEVRAGNRPAIALYRSLGFETAGLRRAYYRAPEEDALLLQRALPPDPRCC
jgi:ribosomal-protein-alanine N-acetyltransferase